MCFYCVRCGSCDRASIAEEFERDLRTLRCIVCGSELEEGAVYCPECGEPAPSPAGFSHSGAVFSSSSSSSAEESEESPDK